MVKRLRSPVRFAVSSDLFSKIGPGCCGLIAEFLKCVDWYYCMDTADPEYFDLANLGVASKSMYNFFYEKHYQRRALFRQLHFKALRSKEFVRNLWLEDPDDNLVLPEKLQSLTIWGQQGHGEFSCGVPQSMGSAWITTCSKLTFLEIYYCCDRYVLPQTLTTFINRNHDNNTKYSFNLPPNLTTLELRFDSLYLESVNIVLPNHLESLKIHTNYAHMFPGSLLIPAIQTIGPGFFPDGLRELGLSWFNPFDLSILPQSLEVFKYECIDRELDISKLPGKLRVLSFLAVRQCILLDEFADFPQSLVSLEVGVNFQEPPRIGLFPQSLKVLRLENLRFELSPNVLPNCLEQLNLGTSFRFKLPELPCSLTHLTLKSVHSQRLNQDIHPSLFREYNH